MQTAERPDASEPAPMGPADAQPDRSFTRGDWLTLLAISGLALLVRLLHLQQLAANDPFYTLASVDGQVYDAWARRIIGGIAEPAEVLNLGPLYPHFIALVYRLTGPSLPAVKLVQALIGAATCGLVWAVARDLFDRRVALIAGLGAVFCGMLVFYGGTIMIVNLQVPLVLLILLTTSRALDEPAIASWIWAGLTLGLSVLARQTALLFVPVVVLWLLWSLRARLPTAGRLACAAAFCLAVLTPILPFTARNILVADDFVLLSANGGPNLYMGNNASSDGAWRPPNIARMRIDNPAAMKAAFRLAAERETGRPMKASEISAFWTRQAIDYIVQNPGAWLRLEARKLALFFNAHEIWNNRSITLSRESSWVLRMPLLGFGVIAPLGLLGAALAIGRWRRLLPLYAMLGVYLSAALIFFVLSRYRMPAVPILMIFGAFALTRIVDAIQGRRLRALSVMLVTLTALTIVIHRPIREENLYMAWFNLGNKLRTLEQWDRAADSYGRSIAINPGFVPAHQNLALSYEGAGRTTEAIARWREVLAMARARGDIRMVTLANEGLLRLGATGRAPGSAAAGAEPQSQGAEDEQSRQQPAGEP